MLEPRVDALVIQVSAMFFGSEAVGIERDAACVMPSVSMTRALSLQWTARCARTIPRDGLRVVEPLRHQDEETRIS